MTIPSDILPIVHLDGAYLPARRARISAFDRGFLVADGIFETLHVYQGAPIELQAHLRRLFVAARFMELALPWSSNDLTGWIAGTLKRNDFGPESTQEAAIRLTVTRGEGMDGPPSIFMYVRQLAPEHLAKRELGLGLHRLPWTGRGDAGLAQHKTLSYLASSLGQVWLRQNVTDPRAEGLFVATSGEVLEGTSSNVFIVEGDAVTTPPVQSGVLAGISREVVLQLAPSLGLKAQEQIITVDRMERADEVFITSSTLRLAPVMSLDETAVGTSSRGPVVKRLQDAFTERVQAEVQAYWSTDG